MTPLAPTSPMALRSTCGTVIPLRIDRWRAPASPGEQALLAHLEGPVLDVGCGPGRLVVALMSWGRVALGIDVSRSAVTEALARGAPALRRDVFEPLPGEGRWAAALLLDGNVGIGGDPLRLFRRLRQLLAPGGVALVEVEPPGQPAHALHVRLHVPRPGGDQPVGPWFPWARVGADAVSRLAGAAGLSLADLHPREGRWFAWMGRP